MGKVDELMDMIEDAAETAKSFGLCSGDVKKTMAHAVRIDGEVREKIEAIRTTLSACVAEWQGMESAPTDGTRLLAWLGPKRGAEIIRWGNLYYTDGTGWVDWYGSDIQLPDELPTKWQPIPDPSTETEGETK